MTRSYTSSREKILDATERVILRDGPGAVSVGAVLKEAAISKGGFFHHFATKDALLGALIERLSAGVAAQAAGSMQSDTSQRGRFLRAQIALAFDMPAAERERTRALVLALLAAVMEAPAVATHARRANEQAIAAATDDGVPLGRALVVQLALDGYFLGQSFATIKLDGKRRAAIRETLLGLVAEPKGVKRG